MIARNHESLCSQAEPYYYDFLFNESRELIPEPVVNHIVQCQNCQQQINQLEAVLSQTDGPESKHKQVNSAVTTMLTLHFAYIGKPVTCKTTKPFLPSLLDTALKIGIPTPITVHLDNCRKCSEDLETIHRLNLTRKQLRRLSQLFADEPTRSNISCAEAQNAIPLVVSMVFSETDSEVLRHLCICPDCRKVLYQRREIVLRGLLKSNTAENKFPCMNVSARDFFDYVAPYGLDPANDQYAKFRESLTSHLRTCPTCLVKMQQLHETMYRIVEQPESEITTAYHINESAKTRIASESDDLYAGFPIRVDITRREEVKAEQPVPAIDFTATLKQKVSIEKLKPLLKTSAVAAAIILMAVILFQNIPTAKAVTLERIYKAIEKVRNVHITSFTPPNKEPTQELWISRTLNIYVTKTAKQSVLWDIANKTRKTKQLDTGIIKTVRLIDDIIVDIKRKMSSTLDLMPFYDVSDVPENADWNLVATKDLDTTNKGIEVYDLTWIERAYDSSTVFKKWRVFADSETNIPQRIEWYEKSASDAEYILSLMMMVEYLNDNEIKEVIKEASF